MLNRLKGISFEFEQKISTQFNKISKKRCVETGTIFGIAMEFLTWKKLKTDILQREFHAESIDVIID